VVFAGLSRLVRAGMTISVTFSVENVYAVPFVTVFNNQAASASNDQSPFTFTYEVKEGDVGPIMWTVDPVTTGTDRGNVTFTDPDRIAGNSIAYNTHAGPCFALIGYCFVRHGRAHACSNLSCL